MANNIYNSETVRWPTFHDPDDKRHYELPYRPPIHAVSTRYRVGNYTKPITDNGCIYECTSGGISAASGTVFLTVEDGATTDGDVTWICHPDTCILKEGDSITVSTWESTGSTIDSDSIVDNYTTTARLTAVPTGASSVTLTNHVTISRVDLSTEEIDRSIIIRIRES